VTRADVELEHLRFVETNLRARVTELEAEVARLRQGDWVLWDLWCRDVRPGWRMWRIKRRYEATRSTLTEEA